jgi:hypothetical protein
MSTGHNIGQGATIDPDDLLVLVFVGSQVGADEAYTITDPSGYTQILDHQYNVGGENRQHLWVGAKEAVGNEDGATVNVVTSQSVSAVGMVLRYQAGTHNGVAGVFANTVVQGEAANPNPGSLNPGLGAQDFEWVAGMTHEDSDFGATGAPASYATLTTAISDSTEDAVLSLAFRQLNAASEDPGAFTADSEKYQAFTLAIEPVGGGGSTDTVSLFPTADGTLADVVDETDATSDLFASIDDDPASPNDGDWINNTDDAGQHFVAVKPAGGGDLAANFDSADSATITVRYRGQEFGSGTVTLYARLYASNESTPLSDEVQVAQVTANGSFANTSAVTLTGIVASDKATWDGARLRLRWETT